MHPAISQFLTRTRIADMHKQARRDAQARTARGRGRGA